MNYQNENNENVSEKNILVARSRSIRSSTSPLKFDTVVTDVADEFFCGATKGTNNTGELCGIGQGLMWLRDVVANAELSAPTIVDAPAVMLYDFGYSANIATRRWKANANEALVAWVWRRSSTSAPVPRGWPLPPLRPDCACIK